jgi:spermidine/putrescine transport system permease protein
MARRHRSEGLTIYATLYLLFLYGPVLLLPLFSFNDSYYVAFPLRSFTFVWYRQMAENTPLLEALQASLKVAVSVAVISTVLGVLAAKALTRYDLPGRAPITGFIMLPLVIPSLVLALALLVVLRRILDPLAWPGIVSSLLLCFSASFDEYVLAAFLSGNQGTLPVFIFSQLRFPQRLPGVLALGSCILLGSLILVAFAEWIRRRGTGAATLDLAPAT